MLYQHDVTGLGMEELRENSERAEQPLDDPYALEVVSAVLDERDEIDGTITAAAEGWTADRLGALERNILRVAVWEMRSGEVSTAVAINEAVEIAKRYCGAEAPAFVNGVLGRVASERRDGGG